MLGELCRQQRLRIKPFRLGVAVNADDALRESRAVRRGADHWPAGWHFDPATGEDRLVTRNLPP
jgi:hypothetical protein